MDVVKLVLQLEFSRHDCISFRPVHSENRAQSHVNFSSMKFELPGTIAFVFFLTDVAVAVADVCFCFCPSVSLTVRMFIFDWNVLNVVFSTLSQF